MRLTRFITAVIVCFPLALRSDASVTTYTATAAPGASPDANSNTVNVWDDISSGGGNYGNFLGNSALNGGGSGAGAGNPAWAMWADSGGKPKFSASISSLAGTPLTLTNQFVSIDFDNGWIDSGEMAGVDFLDNSGNKQLAFYYAHGVSSYQVEDSSGNHLTSLGFTADGFNLKLTLTGGSGGYKIDAGSATVSGILQQATSNLGKVVVYKVGSVSAINDRDLFFNNLTISTSVPEASAMAFGALASSGLLAAWCARRLRRPAQEV